jgi:N-acyl-L-homoserine lactone synthetase
VEDRALIECFTQATNHRFLGNPYAEQARLRYEALEGLNWKIPLFHRERAEQDEYDTPETVYFIRRDEELNPLACMRLCRTDLKYRLRGIPTTFMLRDVFSSYVTGPQSLYVGGSYREGSRLCAALNLRQSEKKELRRRIVDEILVGVMEYSVEHSIKGIYGTMPTKVFNSTWGRTKCKVQWLSEEVSIDEFPSRLAIKIISQEALDRVRGITGLHEGILNYGDW